MTKIEQLSPTAKQLQRWQNEVEIVASAFQIPRTMYQVAKVTGIERPNVCRRVATLRENGRIAVVKTDLDPLTHRRAQFFCTDKRHWLGYHINGAQAKLFE